MPSSPDQAFPTHRVIPVHVRELTQLFNSMDPSPFHARDLDPNAEEFIIESARELAPDGPLAVEIVLDQPPAGEDAREVAREAIQSHFRRVSTTLGSQLRQLFAEGRIALLIGLSCVVGAVVVGELVGRIMGDGPTTAVIRESLIIGGWVAMWRPMEVFLYDWWPIRYRQRLFNRLARSEVRIVPAGRA
jgi:hypothetical protein